MTTTEMIAVCVNVCRILDAQGSTVAAETLREVADALRAGMLPHPDTARADAAERMLYDCLTMADNYNTRAVAKCLTRDVSGLYEWTQANEDRILEASHIAGLIAKRDAARAEAARLDAELAAMGGKDS